jgi:hypothetical protein
MPDS